MVNFMGILRTLAWIIGAYAVLVGIFFQLTSIATKSFQIDYSTAPGKTIVITGANSGLGYQAAYDLAKHGAKVIMACRSITKCEEAKRTILVDAPTADVTCMQLDLTSFTSVRNFAKAFQDTYHHLDVLINNAGIGFQFTRTTTVDGIETTQQANHLGHFMLTALLYPILRTQGRIINHSSAAHHFAYSSFPSANMQCDASSYYHWYCYGNSKLANILFTYELNHLISLQNNNPRNITALVVHPGYTETSIFVNKANPSQRIYSFIDLAFIFGGMPLADGAKSLLFAAIDPQAVYQDKMYIGPYFEFYGRPAYRYTSHRAWWQPEDWKVLWKESVRLTGIDFDSVNIVGIA